MVEMRLASEAREAAIYDSNASAKAICYFNFRSDPALFGEVWE